MTMLVRLTAAGVLALLLSACATMRGAPVSLASHVPACKVIASSQIDPIVITEPECGLAYWRDKDADELKLQRNHVVTTRLYLLDKYYLEFERHLLNEGRGASFAVTLAQLGIGTAGTLSGSEEAGRVLSTINTAITGAREGFSREILIERTVQVLITQMRAGRAKQKTLILQRLQQDYATWPIGLAMSDLLAYENAGSLSSALTGIAETAATERRLNEDEAEQALVVAYDASASGTALQDYLSVGDDKLAKTRADHLASAMLAAKVPPGTVDPVTFAFGNDPRKQDVLVALMAIEKDDPEALAVLAAGVPAPTTP